MTKNMIDHSSDAQQQQAALQDQLKKGEEIVVEIDKIKQGAADMPNELDEDIKASIKGAVDSARQEARGDMQEVAREQQSTKTEIKGTQEKVGQKIQGNETARGKLEGISGSYGDAQIQGAVSKIEASTRLGEQINSELNAAVQEATSRLGELEGKI